MRDRAKDAAATALRLPGLGLLALPLERHAARRPGPLWVLTYHRVCPPGERPDLAPGLISATPQVFARQMDYVARRCRAVTLAEVLAAWAGAEPLPPRAVLITFDDAYRDFAQHALPVLRRHRLPAVLFVPTAYPDQPGRRFWWDRLHQAVGLAARRGSPLATPLGALAVDQPARARAAHRRLSQHIKALPHDQAMAAVDALCAGVGGLPDTAPAVLGWAELRALSGQGVALAAHSRTHPLLHRLPSDLAQVEIAGSLADLGREAGPCEPVLAYPGGGFDDTTVRLVAAAGLRLAFTTEPGVNRPGPGTAADPLRLRRIHVGRRVSELVFRLRLTLWSDGPAARRGSGAATIHSAAP